MTPILETRSIKKYFPVNTGIAFLQKNQWVRAVDGVNLQVQPGETVGLVGESGCGKSTIVKLLLLLLELSDGEILFHGKPLSEFTSQDFISYRRDVQVVFQNPYSSLNPRMSVGRIISEPLEAIGKPLKSIVHNRMVASLETVGLDPAAAEKYPHQFSGGQRQRIAIARALINQPGLIILDEPVSSQDVSIRAQLLNLLKDLQGALHMSFLFIGHDLATVRFMSDRIMVMYLGEIVETAPADDLCTEPMHPYTKALLAASLPDKPDANRKRHTLPGEVPSPLNPPTGCRFHTRCPVAMPQCSHIKPELKPVAPDRSVACLIYDEGKASA